MRQMKWSPNQVLGLGMRRLDWNLKGEIKGLDGKLTD